MKKLALLTLSMAVVAVLTGCGSNKTYENGEVVVYNWGEYIDPETIEMFASRSFMMNLKPTKLCTLRLNQERVTMMLFVLPIT